VAEIVGARLIALGEVALVLGNAVLVRRELAAVEGVELGRDDFEEVLEHVCAAASGQTRREAGTSYNLLCDGSGCGVRGRARRCNAHSSVCARRPSSGFSMPRLRFNRSVSLVYGSSSSEPKEKPWMTWPKSCCLPPWR
jgi:hypothetical protein